jgi:Tfp pilus assembly protein PilZ
VTTQGKERRRAVRRRAHHKVRFWNQEIDGSGFVTNVSQSGLFVETRKLPAVGTRLHLEIYLTDVPFMAEAEVARVQNVSSAIAGVRANGFGLRLVTWHEVIDPAHGSLKAAGAAPRTIGTGTATDPLVCDLTDPTRLQATFTDEICRGGLFVSTAAVLSLGTQVTVSLSLPPPHAAQVVHATVVHRNDNPAGVGLQLANVQELRGQLSALLASLAG